MADGRRIITWRARRARRLASAGLLGVLASGIALGTPADAQRSPMEVEASVRHLEAYSEGGCFLEVGGGREIAPGHVRRCSEYSWTLTNTTPVPIRGIQVSDDIDAILARHGVDGVPAELIDIGVIEAVGMRAESFRGGIFVAVADTVPAEGAVAIRLRIEIEHPIGGSRRPRP